MIERTRGYIVKRRPRKNKARREKRKVRDKELREARRAAGKCTECGKDQHHAGNSPYASLCIKCEERRRKWRRKRYGWTGYTQEKDGDGSGRGSRPVVKDKGGLPESQRGKWKRGRKKPLVKDKFPDMKIGDCAVIPDR